jgi:hypothetical protein
MDFVQTIIDAIGTPILQLFVLGIIPVMLPFVGIALISELIQNALKAVVP